MANPASTAESTTQSGAAQELAALLQGRREEIASSWLEVIRRGMPNAAYARRPSAEILANNLGAQDMFVAWIEGKDPLAEWESSDIPGGGLAYVLGIGLNDIVEALWLLKDAVLPYILEIRPSGPAVIGALTAQLDASLRACVGAMVATFSRMATRYLQKEQERTAILLEMAGTASGTLDLDRVLRNVARGIAAAAQARHCLLILVDEVGQAEAPWVTTEPAGPTAPGPARQIVRSALDLYCWALVQQAMQERRPAACCDAGTDGRTDREQASTLGLKSLLAVPCVAKNQVLAVALVYTWEDCRTFTGDQIELAAGVANVAAPAIENARLYRQVEQLAALEERTTLSRELHDELAQSLGAIQLKASLAASFLADGRVDRSMACLQELQEMAAAAYAGVRESIFNLRASVTPGSRFLTSLRDYLADYRLHYGMDVCLEASDAAIAELSGDAELQVIRIVQEALANARRHAMAAKAWVRISGSEGEVHVSIEDNGRGFDPAGAAHAGRPHFGLHVMRERAEKVGGSLELDSCPGQGTRILVRLPGSPDFYPR